jgi:hypothetical protein
VKTNHQQAMECLDRAAAAFEADAQQAAQYWLERAQVYATLATLDR